MILVTGASKGLGRAICDRLISRDLQVMGLARDTSGLPFEARSCDISSAAQLKAVTTELKRSGVQVTGVINAAGIAAMNLAVTTPAATVERVIHTNLIGTILVSQAFAPLMMRHKAGRIINFSTIAVAIGLKGESVYAASKAGVEAFSRVFAREMADFGITVNCIAPGPIATDLLRGITSAQIDSIVGHQVIAKQFTPDAVCDVVELLLSDKASSVSGQVLHIGGV